MFRLFATTLSETELPPSTLTSIADEPLRRNPLIPEVYDENGNPLFPRNLNWLDYVASHLAQARSAMLERTPDIFVETIAKFYQEDILPYEAEIGESFPSYLHEYYQNFINKPDLLIPLGMPTLQILSDYFAYHNRRWRIENDPTDWSQTSFILNPFGIPRVRDWGEYPTQHTRTSDPKYRAYSLRAPKQYAVTEFPIPYVYNPQTNKWRRAWEPRKNETPETLTMGIAPFWIHTDSHKTFGLWKVGELILKEILFYEPAKIRREQLYEPLPQYIPHDRNINIIDRYIAQLVWWQSHIMHYRRGSAAILGCVDLLLSNYSLTPNVVARKGVIIDLEAMITPSVLQFMSNWSSLRTSKEYF